MFVHHIDVCSTVGFNANYDVIYYNGNSFLKVTYPVDFYLPNFQMSHWVLYEINVRIVIPFRAIWFWLICRPFDVSFVTIDRFPFVLSRISIFDKHTVEKWLGFPHLLQDFPNAGHSSFCIGCVLPQYLHVLFLLLLLVLSSFELLFFSFFLLIFDTLLVSCRPIASTCTDVSSRTCISASVCCSVHFLCKTLRTSSVFSVVWIICSNILFPHHHEIHSSLPFPVIVLHMIQCFHQYVVSSWEINIGHSVYFS